MKRNSMSLMWKLFAIILTFAAVIVFVFIIFQISLLDTFYKNNKIKRSNYLIEEISNVVSESDVKQYHDGTGFIVNQLVKYSRDEDIQVFIYDKPTKVGNTDVFNNNILYKSISGNFINELSPEIVNQIWNEGLNLQNDYFYVVKSINPVDDRIGSAIQIHSLDLNPKKLTRDLSNENDSIYCCSFVKLSNNQTYLLVLDNKIIPVSAAVDTLKLQLTYIAIIVVAITIIVALLLSRSLSKPIRKMNETAKQMAKGDYEVVFEGSGYKEIDELNKTLNNTAKELAKTETLRRELMANVSHDLKTPLTMIKGYAEMMKDLPGENTLENLQIIVDEANRLNILVNDMLDLSRLSAKTTILNKQEYSLTDSLIDIVDRFKKFHELNDYQFSLTFDKNVTVVADESKIEQVMYNFINNAINYSGDNKKIEIIQEIDQDSVTVKVKDHGIGIKEEELAIIWERYYRVDKGHKRSNQGSGLGLSIVKGILEYHNFDYGVESKIGEGSTFWFKLPIK